MAQKAILVLNGELDTLWLEKNIPKAPVFCADGAYDRCKGLSFDIRAVIGDLDSLDDKGNLEAELVHMPDQDLTDFEKALGYLSKRFQKIEIFGASGGEMDHFLGNLSVAKRFMEKTELIFYDPHQYYYFLKKKSELKDMKGRMVSIMPFPKVENITSEGLQYELDGQTLELGGLLSIRNRAKKDKIKISFDKGCAIIFIGNKIIK